MTALGNASTARLARIVFAAAALWVAVAPPSRAAEPGPEPAAGQLLIASAAMQDRRFHHSVILLLQHDASGAFGLIINRRIAEKPIAALLTDSNGGSDAADRKLNRTIQVFLGGPVQPERGFIVHSAEYERPETLRVDEAFAMTASREILRDIGREQGPKKYLFAVGYAGWGAGQLDSEIARRDWFTAPADPELVFDAERDQVWERALARRTRDL
jgi:putative transcriptional regulator